MSWAYRRLFHIHYFIYLTTFVVIISLPPFPLIYDEKHTQTRSSTLESSSHCLLVSPWDTPTFELLYEAWSRHFLRDVASNSITEATPTTSLGEGIQNGCVFQGTKKKREGGPRDMLIASSPGPNPTAVPATLMLLE